MDGDARKARESPRRPAKAVLVGRNGAAQGSVVRPAACGRFFSAFRLPRRFRRFSLPRCEKPRHQPGLIPLRGKNTETGTGGRAAEQGLMQAPESAFDQTVTYIRICGAGSIFIVAYNVLGGVF